MTVQEIDLVDGHALLFTTDGMYRKVPPDTVRDTIASAPDPNAAAERLIELALELDGSDNATVLVARYVADTLRIEGTPDALKA